MRPELVKQRKAIAALISTMNRIDVSSSFDNENKTVIGDLRRCKSIRNKEITPIGGRATGLGDESSDLDVIIWTNDENVKGELRRLYKYYSRNYHFRVRRFEHNSNIISTFARVELGHVISES